MAEPLNEQIIESLVQAARGHGEVRLSLAKWTDIELVTITTSADTERPFHVDHRRYFNDPVWNPPPQRKMFDATEDELRAFLRARTTELESATAGGREILSG